MAKIGLKLWSTNVGAWYEVASRLFSEGVFDYLELFVVPGTSETLPRWQRLRMRLNLPFVIHAPHSACGFNLADATRRESNRRIYEEVRAFADSLKAGHVIFHGGTDGTVAETVRQLADLGERRALIENKPFAPLPNSAGARFCRGATASEIRQIIRGTGCGFCLDVGHAVCSANSQGLAPYAFVRELAARFQPVMFHLSDISDMSSSYDAHPHLGAGELDLDKICREIFPAGTSISVETEKNSPDDLDDFRRDVESLRGFLV